MIFIDSFKFSNQEKLFNFDKIPTLSRALFFLLLYDFFIFNMLEIYKTLFYIFYIFTYYQILT